MLLPIIVGLTAFVAACAGSGSTTLPPKQPLHGNKREEWAGGNEYVDNMIAAAKARVREDNKFRIFTLFAPNCSVCEMQTQAAKEIQTTQENVDVATFVLDNKTAGTDSVIPVTILQYSDCKNAVVTSSPLEAKQLGDILSALKQSCETHQSVSFDLHFAPLTL